MKSLIEQVLQNDNGKIKKFELNNKLELIQFINFIYPLVFKVLDKSFVCVDFGYVAFKIKIQNCK